MKWLDLAALAGLIVLFVGIYLAGKRKVNFTVLTLAGLGLGIPLGLAARGHAEYLEPFGKIYINVLLASVAPLIVVAIISSVASLGSIAKLRSIGLRSAGWLLASNALGVILALGIALASGTGRGVHDTVGGQELSVLENSVQSFTDVVVGFFPVNVVGAFGSNAILPIIVIAVTVSVAYLALLEKDGDKVRPFGDGIQALKLVIFKAVGYVIKLTPYAVTALTASVVATTANLGDKFWSLLGLLGLAWATCFLHTFGINSAIVRIAADLNPIVFFKKILPAQVTAFTTQSSVGTLPVTTRVLTRKVGVHPEVAHFTAPLGTTIGMPGCSGIWPILIAVWGINAYDISYSLQQYAILALLATVVSIGTAGVPGTATVAAATVLAAAGLPLDFIAVTLPISAIADMARTATNVTAAAVSATVVARHTGLLDDAIFRGEAELDESEPSQTPVRAESAPVQHGSTHATPSPSTATFNPEHGPSHDSYVPTTSQALAAN